MMVQLVFYASTPELAARLISPLPLAMTAVLVALMITAMFVRGQLWTRLAMIALVGRYIIVYLL
jgi:hypothetical protein